VDLRGPFYISLYNVKPVSHDTVFVRGPRQKPMLPMPKTASDSLDLYHLMMLIYKHSKYWLK
jgi:hypothetical protein